MSGMFLRPLDEAFASDIPVPHGCYADVERWQEYVADGQRELERLTGLVAECDQAEIERPVDPKVESNRLRHLALRHARRKKGLCTLCDTPVTGAYCERHRPKRGKHV